MNLRNISTPVSLVSKGSGEFVAGDGTASQERDLLEATLNNLPGVFYLFDESLKFLRWNKRFEIVLGYSGEEFARLSPLDLFRADEREFITGKIHHAFTTGTSSAEACLIAKDGTGTPYYFKAQRIQIEGKICIIGTGIDISERKQLEAQFIEAQKMEVIGQLAGGVAHDFNNVLAVIMGYTDLLASSLEQDHPLQKFTQEIRHASERAVGLTRQLLVFSRNETVRAVVLDLETVVQEQEKMLRRLIGENIEMTIVSGKITGRIKADPGYVGQVVMNLVINARDAMPNGGNLIIGADNVTLDKNCIVTPNGTTPGDYVMLSVSDTGTGMTGEVKARVFEAFFTTKPAGKGTGLGLATCQTIVQNCGGFICVDSEIGKGTTFHVYFPRVDLPLDIATTVLKNERLPRGTETLLLVEDEPSVRDLARTVLEAQGYTVLVASNGQDGLHMAQEHKVPPIRLVVTDVVMPLMGGKVMAEWLKTTYPDLKILFTSGYTDDAIAHLDVMESDVAFLSKPYTPATLTRKVREMLDAP